MDLGLKSRVALIAGRQYGRLAGGALALAQEGANISICARGSEALEATAEEIRSVAGVEAYVTQTGMSGQEDVGRLAIMPAE